jgi:hypothetical protein
VDLGGGAYFHAVDAINGYQLKFPNPGNYEIEGNINMPIVAVAGVYVERKTSAAFATVAGGSSGGGATSGELDAAKAEIIAAIEGKLSLAQFIALK